MSGALVLFWAFAGLALASALACITRRSPVASALWLVVTLFALAALFVLMLLNLGRPGPMDVKGPVGVGTAFLLGGVLLFQLWILRQAALPASIQLPPGSMARLQQEQGFVAAIAQPLFDTYLIPFEITSLLLLAALVGAVVLAKRRL